MRFAPFAALLLFLASGSARSAEPDVAAWIDRVRAAREDGAPREERWKALARDVPVLADWMRQDLGDDAPRILGGDGHVDAVARLVARVSADLSLPSEPAAGNPDLLLGEYIRLAVERRKRRISTTLEKWGPVAFTEGHSYRMSFIGYTEGLSDARNERFFQPGARLSVLGFDAGSVFGGRKVLLDDPRGMMRDVDVSFDLGKLLFAWKKSDRLDDYHLYEYELGGGAVRQLTQGLGRADYEPIYLPDGDILFTSTRPEQSVPCFWTEISNLYRMDGDGGNIRRLAIDQVHALYPQLMADGRVTYTRWDYNDRGQVYPHPLFSMLPDGRDQRAFYGGNSWYPNSLLHARGIPGSHKAVAVAAGHHTWQQGKLVVLDVGEGRDEGRGMSFLAPRREVPYERVDHAMQDGPLFRHPYPFSEDEFLVSARPSPEIERFGLYWMNADGDRELLHSDPSLDVARMVPLRLRPEVAEVPEAVDYAKNTGIYYVRDVYQGVGLEGVPRGEAKKIRVVALDYRAAGVGMTQNRGEGGGALNSSPVAIGNGTWDVKRILGDAEIEEDGSARFEVPAMESIYLQVLDAAGRVIQTTRTWDTLRPGETKGCAGCHDKADGNRHPYQEDGTLAWARPPQKLQPFHGAPRGFSFPKEIQPVLDSKCVSCHGGTDPERMDLRGTPVDDAPLDKRRWSRSYLNLTGAMRTPQGGYVAAPEEGIVSWISKMSRPTEIPPYFAGAARSPLVRMLEEGHHGVVLTSVEKEKISAWIDLLVPFSGDYREGHAWTEHEMAFYGYYEGKRRASEAEEAAVAARRGGVVEEPASADVPKFTRARYREVMSGVELAGGRVPDDQPVCVIDTIHLRFPQAAAVEIRVRNSRTGETLATAAGAGDVALMLSKPVRSDELVVETDGSPAAGVTIESTDGVALDEVPVIDGFHPFLDLGRR